MGCFFNALFLLTWKQKDDMIATGTIWFPEKLNTI